MAMAMPMAMAASATGFALRNRGRGSERRRETVRFSKKWTASLAKVASYSSSSSSFSSSSPQIILQSASLHRKEKVSARTSVSLSFQKTHVHAHGETHVHAHGDHRRVTGSDEKILKEEAKEEGKKEEGKEESKEEGGEEEELEGGNEEEQAKAKSEEGRTRNGISWLMIPATIRRLAFVLIFAKVVSSITSTLIFWTYVRWFLETWPFPAAIVLGLCSIFVAMRKKESERDKLLNRLITVGGSLTWLILVPIGFRNGYVQGWPLLLFFVYTCFFLFSRCKWSRGIEPRYNAAEITFLASIAGGHWLAAFEGSQLYFLWNLKLPSRIAIICLAFSVVLHYYATYLLGKHVDSRLENPTDLVVLGPYQFIRHPLYASYMLLFSGYCIALRAYWSMTFLLLASLLYFEHRVKVEEEQLEESFHGQYKTYKGNVTSKYFFLLY